jgi:hypothetical protein
MASELWGLLMKIQVSGGRVGYVSGISTRTLLAIMVQKMQRNDAVDLYKASSLQRSVSRLQNRWGLHYHIARSLARSCLM